MDSRHVDKSWDVRLNSPKSGVSFFSCPHGGRRKSFVGFFSCPHGGRGKYFGGFFCHNLRFFNFWFFSTIWKQNSSNIGFAMKNDPWRFNFQLSTIFRRGVKSWKTKKSRPFYPKLTYTSPKKCTKLRKLRTYVDILRLSENITFEWKYYVWVEILRLSESITFEWKYYVWVKMTNHFLRNPYKRPGILSNRNPTSKNPGTFVRVPQKVVSYFLAVRTVVEENMLEVF